ncbi:MAG: DNA topoisomerase [Promethearchaeota archaeon]
MSTIIISEKAKAARAIAEALGNIKIIKERNIYLYSVPSKDIVVIPLRGHIMQYENTLAYKKWKLETNRDIITDPNAISKIPSSYAKPYIAVLKKYAKTAQKCIIGTDADIEGAVIGLIDAYFFVKQANKSIKLEQLWLNTLQKKDIVSAYNNLIPPKWTWAYAGEARAKIDAIIGFSATREVTLTLRPILNKLNCKLASIGRVQTCLLYLLYLREYAIRTFVPEKYWIINAKLIPNTARTSSSNKLLLVNHKNNPFKKEKEAEKIYNKIKNEKEGEILDIIKKPHKVKPPTPLNTSKALVLLTKTLGIKAKVALKTMEDLYLNKIISYPRTDTDIYKKNYDHLQILNKFSASNTYGSYAQYLLQNKRITPTKGKTDAGDHPPITPLISLEPNSTKFENQLQRKVYDVIARYYLALFGEPAEELKTTITVDIKEEPFVGKFTVLIYEGFFRIAPFLKPQYDIDIPLNKGKIKINKISLEEKETQPPPRYTDTTLLKLMEQKNIGTKSTRPQHIETLIERQYAKRIKKTIYITELGYMLIDTLKSIWLPFLKPNFTTRVEKELEEVQKGNIKMDDAVNKIINEFLILFDKFRANKQKIIDKMDDIIDVGNVIRDRRNKIIDNDKKGGNQKDRKKRDENIMPSKDEKDDHNITTSLCPICKSAKMKLVITKDNKHFMACTNPQCKSYLPLPKKGKPTLLKSTCKLCGFNIVKMTRKNAKTKKNYNYYVCPYCFKIQFKTHQNIGLCFKCENYTVERGRCKPR